MLEPDDGIFSSIIPAGDKESAFSSSDMKDLSTSFFDPSEVWFLQEEITREEQNSRVITSKYGFGMLDFFCKIIKSAEKAIGIKKPGTGPGLQYDLLFIEP